MDTATPWRGSDHGFSLVETITVVLIIGLLAAIAIPLYLDQTAKARDAVAQSDLNSIAKAFRIALQEDPGSEPALAVSGSSVTLDGETIAALSGENVLGELHWTSFEEWCIDITNPVADRAATVGYMFNAPDGESSEGQCS